jgi:hypothetical protein
MAENSPLTVAGAAAALNSNHSHRIPTFNPHKGDRRIDVIWRVSTKSIVEIADNAI